MTVLVITGDDHIEEDGNCVRSELFMVAETQFDNLTNKGAKMRLIILTK